MIHYVTSRAARAFLATALALTAAPGLRAQTRPAAPPIRLVVVFTLDQFQQPYLDRYEKELTGGLRRLLDGGAYFTNAYQDHAITETAAAHAVLLAGRFPRSTGIVSNTPDVTDATSPLIGGGGSGASPFRFRGGTLVDWMRVQDLRSRGLSVSRKPRSAILPFGRSQQPAYWFAKGRFTTSSWYADTLPTWVNNFNARGLPRSYAGEWWTLLQPESQYTERDSVPIEHAGKDFLFPHQLPADSTILDKIIDYPVMDQLTLTFALEGVRAMKLGAGNSTDILNISLSATDAVGHRFGPESREIHDQILRVDRALGAFIDSLYATVDSARIVFALTADHGITPFPELHNSPDDAKASKANMRPALAAARAVLRARGADTTAVTYEDGMLSVNRRRLPNAFNIDETLDAFTRVARAHPAVTAVIRRRDLVRMDTVKNAQARRWIHTLPDDHRAELLLTLRDGAIWGSGVEAEHGTPRDIDAHVPIFFYGPPFVPGRYGEFVRSVDIAATLARVIGVTPYERLDGRVLARAIRD